MQLFTSESVLIFNALFSAVYLEAYVRTRYNDDYTGYYSLVSKKLNKYGQFTLTNRTSEAVIVHVDIGDWVDGTQVPVLSRLSTLISLL